MVINTQPQTNRKPWQAQYEKQVPPSLNYPDGSLDRFLDETVLHFPHRIATIFLGAQLTYKELGEQVEHFARALQILGVRHGDRVALLLPNCPQFIIAYYATHKIGGIVVPTNPLYTGNELRHQLNDAGAETIVLLDLMYPLLASIEAQTKLRRVIVTSIKDYLPPVKAALYPIKQRREGHIVKVPHHGTVFHFNELLQRNKGKPAYVQVNSDDIALLQYTGGTTGTPKAAMLTHHNLVANTCQIAAWMWDTDPNGGDILLAAIPFFHVYGMTSAMSFAISTAQALLLIPRFSTRDVLKAIHDYHPTSFPGVPTMYIALNNDPQVGKYDLRSIRACISGAAPLPVEVATKFEELTGARVVEGYGLTETSPVTHCNPLYGRRKAGSIGVPLPDLEARVTDPDTGEEVAVGEIGEMVVRGPQVMKGYWQKPEETARVLKDGWLKTGDMVRQDQDGFFYVVDRKKDIIIAGGFNIYPREIEEILYQHPAIAEAVVAGIPDAYRGETVKAYIVLKAGETVTAAELIKFCEKQLARFKLPKQVEFRETLPKSLVGKHLRRVLIEEEKAKLAVKPLKLA